MYEWRRLHDELTARLLDEGAALLADPRWRVAWDECPRHRFIPERVWVKRGAEYHAAARGEPGFDWWGLVYSDQHVTVQVDDGHLEHSPGAVGKRATSSASEPLLVATMLQLADLRPEHRVLEVGAGVGWSSSLTAAYVGDENVTSVEIDGALAALAAANARRAGRSHLIVRGDGLAGWWRRAPFDRVVLTCAVSRVPPELIAQTAPGGKLLVPYSTSGVGGAMALLTADDDGGASGPFVAEAHMMQSRTQRPERAEKSAGPARERTSELPGEAFADWPARTLLELAIPDLVITAPRRRSDDWLWVTARAADGSRASAPVQAPGSERFEAHYDVYERGPRDLWSEIEAAWVAWRAAGCPAMAEHRLTVDASGKHSVVRGPAGVPACDAAFQGAGS